MAQLVDKSLEIPEVSNSNDVILFHDSFYFTLYSSFQDIYIDWYSSFSAQKPSIENVNGAENKALKYTHVSNIELKPLLCGFAKSGLNIIIKF